MKKVPLTIPSIAISFNGIFLPLYLLIRDLADWKIITYCLLVSIVFAVFSRFTFLKRTGKRKNNL